MKYELDLSEITRKILFVVLVLSALAGLLLLWLGAVLTGDLDDPQTLAQTVPFAFLLAPGVFTIGLSALSIYYLRKNSWSLILSLPLLLAGYFVIGWLFVAISSGLRFPH